MTTLIETHRESPGQTAAGALPYDRRVRRPDQLPWIVAAALGVVAAMMAGFMIARPAQAPVEGERPVIRMSVDPSSWPVNGEAGSVPTAIAYYTDGTRVDASAALSAPWTPPRPVTMVILVGKVTCDLQVGDVMDTEGAGANREAVCVWTAPEPAP